ncbi:MAG TPA: ATP-binding protein [Jatrophihabitans sp.]
MSDPDNDVIGYVIDNDVVDIEVPASSTYVATLRLTATSLAARCELTVDDIDDLGLAVDEACSLLLPHAEAHSAIRARFLLVTGALTVTTSVHAPDASAATPDRSGFAWSVLSALASHVEVTGEGDDLTITVTKRRENAPA